MPRCVLALLALAHMMQSPASGFGLGGPGAAAPVALTIANAPVRVARRPPPRLRPRPPCPFRLPPVCSLRPRSRPALLLSRLVVFAAVRSARAAAERAAAASAPRASGGARAQPEQGARRLAGDALVGARVAVCARWRRRAARRVAVCPVAAKSGAEERYYSKARASRSCRAVAVK